jgi:hypothetical protein
MERIVPTTQTEEIDLYLRTIYSLLRSTTDVQIRTLEEVHAGMNSLLHPDARANVPDTSAFIYSLLRLPSCMPRVRLVVLGQNSSVFEQFGFHNVESWEPVSARARRRRCFYKDGVLACFIASRSDIDDLIPVLVALQLEWNKLHRLLARIPEHLLSPASASDPALFDDLAKHLQMATEDLQRVQVIWGTEFIKQLDQIKDNALHLRVRLLDGSMSEYQRATRRWMNNIISACPELENRPVYFISSNTHSIINILSGFALQHRAELLEYLQEAGNEQLLTEWEDIQNRNTPSSEVNFFYYIMKKYQQTARGQHLIEKQRLYEEKYGVTRIPSRHTFDIEAQVIDLSRLDRQNMDPRLGNDGCCSFLEKSDALILNIDYPLGLAAYNILSRVTEYSEPILGVYIMGKAATLNGVLGDVIIPNVVHDEHTNNTYLFNNAIAAADVTPYLVYGTVLDNQKSVSVLGTFLQNARIMDVFYREGYTDIEMEGGPYLSAVYEMVRPKRHPVNEIANLYAAPFDLGILHYASDTPLSKGKNLGAGTLSYFGMDSTYASSLAILRRILNCEEARIQNKERSGSPARETLVGPGNGSTG